MKYVETKEVMKAFRVGDEVWACAFDYTNSKEGKHLHQKPIKGKLMLGYTEESHKRLLDRGYDVVKYFVPYKKNSKELAWSKSVHVYSRYYATSEKECIELYNDLIQKNITWHQKQVEMLEKELMEEI